MKYSERTIRKKASEIGYQVKKGLQHYLYNGCVFHDINGNVKTGYMVLNSQTGYYEWGSYDANFDFLWTLEDVEKFIENKYKSLKLEY